MNIATYIFGQLKTRYTQYPDDYTKSKFQIFNANAKSETQITIHRDGGLMYYGYLRKLAQGQYIGFCVVINGLMVTNLDGLFSLFENVIATLITNGQLIKFNEQGDIVANVERLYLKHDEISFLTECLRAGFYNLKDSFKPLPPVGYGISNDRVQSFSLQDNISDIVKSGHSNGYTYIYKSNAFNTTQLNGYKEVLRKVNQEKSELTKRLDTLTNEHSKILKQKKQYRFVLILLLLIIGCIVGLLNLNNNLKSTTSDLNTAKKLIRSQNDSINSKNSNILNLQNQNHTLEIKYQQSEFSRQKTEANLDTLHSIIAERGFLIKSTNFNFNTGYLSFEYFSFQNQPVTLQVRVSNEEGYAFSQSADINLLPGTNVAEIYLNTNLDSRTWYYFQILKGNVIVGGDKH